MRRTLSLILSLSLCSAWVHPPRVHAQEVSDGFREHYEQALTLYKEGKYAEAIPELLEAHKIRQLPRILFNVAQAYRKMGRPREAAYYYEEYLRRDTDLSADERQEVTQLLEGVRVQGAPLTVAPSQPTAADPAVTAIAQPLQPVALRPRWDAWFWAGVGLSGGLVISGIITGGYALSAKNELDERRFIGPMPDAALQDLSERRKSFAIATDILIISGVAVLAGSFVRPLLGEVKSKNKTTALRFSISPQGALISGTFN